MPSTNFNLKNIPPDLMEFLEMRSTEQKISINSLILQILEQRFRLSRQKRKKTYHDLDHLAGTWSEKDKQAFDERTKYFNEIDVNF